MYIFTCRFYTYMCIHAANLHFIQAQRHLFFFLKQHMVSV